MNLNATQLEEGRQTVLVIDDSADVHRLLRARLRSEDIELTHAEDGAGGIEMVENDLPALILLDLDMPSMDGFEVLRTLKDRPSTMHVPVIVLSGLQSAQDKVMAFDLGAVDYVTKPFDLTELRVRVRAALRLHQLLQMLSQKAQIDGLTGLWNRAHFDQRWNEEVAGATRHGNPLSLAILDADHFKSINDTFGHPAGDAVLTGIARLLRREARQTDVVSRYGGEEFTLIMPDTAPDNAKVLLDRIRTTLEEVVWPRHPERSVTISIGLVGSEGGPAPVSPEKWLELADANLYKAKSGGRNQVIASSLAEYAPRLADTG